MTYPEAAPGQAAVLLARDVHDRIGSGLALALRRLDLLEMSAATLSEADRSRLQDLRTALDETLEATREIARGRRPAVERRPLKASLEGFVGSMAPDGLDVHLNVVGDEHWLPAALVDEAFQVLREALRNAISHARAAKVSVDVTIAPHELHAVVADDGRGFTPTVGPDADQTDLRGMRERVCGLGGTFGFTSALGRGTRIRFWVPNIGSVRHD